MHPRDTIGRRKTRETVAGIFNSGHPTSLELIGLLDADGGVDALGRGEAVLDHVAGCRTCLAQLLTAADAGDTDISEPSWFAERRLPEQLAVALRSKQPRTARPGQLWRLTWDELFCLAVVVATDQTTATVVAVGDTPSDNALVVDAVRSPLGVRLHVHTSEPTTVALAALDTYLGDIEADLPVRPGAPAARSIAPEALTLRTLAARSLAWVPAADDGDVARLRDQVEAQGLTFDDLADAVGDAPALALWRGERAATADEAQRLHDLGLAGLPVQRRAPQPLLVLVVGDLSFKPQVRAAAERRRTSEADVRLRMVNASLALAARTTGATAATTAVERWRALIEHELRT
jgi:hypothetical protein